MSGIFKVLSLSWHEMGRVQETVLWDKNETFLFSWFAQGRLNIARFCGKQKKNGGQNALGDNGGG